MKLKQFILAGLALAFASVTANATIMAQIGSRGFGFVDHFEDFDSGEFGADPSFFFPADPHHVTSSSGFTFGYGSDVNFGYVVWPGDGTVGFDTRSLYQNGGANAMASIVLTGGDDISQIELDVGNGFLQYPQNVWVRAYNDGFATGSDFEFNLAAGDTISLWATGGIVFDELRIASYGASSITHSESQVSAISFDNVTVGSQPVPEPASVLLLGAGLLGLGFARARKAR